MTVKQDDVPVYSKEEDYVQFTSDEAQIARLRRKIDWRLIPLLSIMYLFSFLDRVNIGKSRRRLRPAQGSVLSSGFCSVLTNILSYSCCNLIGNAKVAGLEKDIGLTPQEYSWALSIFFIGYMVDFVFTPSKTVLLRAETNFGSTSPVPGTITADNFAYLLTHLTDTSLQRHPHRCWYVFFSWYK